MEGGRKERERERERKERKMEGKKEGWKEGNKLKKMNVLIINVIKKKIRISMLKKNSRQRSRIQNSAQRHLG
jgi:hypothetical protein